MCALPVMHGCGCRYEFPDQAALFDRDEDFMVGPWLLVVPVTESGQTSKAMTLPADAVWYEGASGALAAKAGRKATQQEVPVSMDAIPTYLRGGAIIPTRQRARRNTVAAALVRLPLARSQGSGLRLHPSSACHGRAKQL